VLERHRPAIDRLSATHRRLFGLTPADFEFRANEFLPSYWFSSRELMEEFISDLLTVSECQLNKTETLVSFIASFGTLGGLRLRLNSSSNDFCAFSMSAIFCRWLWD
jgi:hypothetical protein